MLAGRHVLLGVSGGIASYKACTLARRLAEAGTAVDVVLTASAAEFVRPVTFEALTGRPVPDKIQEIAFKIGAAILIILMGIALFNDFARL